MYVYIHCHRRSPSSQIFQCSVAVSPKVDTKSTSSKERGKEQNMRPLLLLLCLCLPVPVPASAGCPTDRRSVHLKYLIRVYCTILSVPNHLSQAKWRENSLRHHTTDDDVNEPPSSMDPGQGSGSQSNSREKGGHTVSQ